MTKTTKRALLRGFTLIELMIVIVILAILMVTVLPLMGGKTGSEHSESQANGLNSDSV